VSLTLLLGGTRSGKSLRAETLARQQGLPVSYLATADPEVPGMSARIRAHADRRPASWRTIELGDRLTESFGGEEERLHLLDGLGVWIAGVLHRHPEGWAHLLVEEEIERLLAAVGAGKSLIVVAEQAGEGLLPVDRLARGWLDLLGQSSQRLASAADHVELVVAGRPLPLDPGGPCRPAPRDPAPEGAASGQDVSAGAGPQGPDTTPSRAHGDAMVRPGERDHAVNVLASPPPPWLRQALQAALGEAAGRYPDEGFACQALACQHGRGPEEVVPTNGAAEALWLLGPALRPRLAACLHPAFSEAEAGLRAHAVPVTRVLRRPGQDFRLDPESVPEEADLVILGNPVSPSGTLDPAASILALRRPGRTLVVDEAFMSMIPGEPGSLASEPHADVIVIRSLTKLLSIPGLRVGYALAPPELASALRAVRPPWSANALALAALAAAAEHPAELAELAERAAAEREDLAEGLRRLRGVRSWPSQTNFLLVEVPDGEAVLRALRTRGIAVRPAASFPGLGPGYLRLTARDPQANAHLVQALEEALAE
jgi:histidinol-phosphate/aromatic aminotransferase/cobyric acid decarboxylase-like protein/adenosyl cobinamide kinase/adenosyl cobinamide phosphate guanylyltransferase